MLLSLGNNVFVDDAHIIGAGPVDQYYKVWMTGQTVPMALQGEPALNLVNHLWSYSTVSSGPKSDAALTEKQLTTIEDIIKRLRDAGQHTIANDLHEIIADAL